MEGWQPFGSFVPGGSSWLDVAIRAHQPLQQARPFHRTVVAGIENSLGTERNKHISKKKVGKEKQGGKREKNKRMGPKIEGPTVETTDHRNNARTTHGPPSPHCEH